MTEEAAPAAMPRRDPASRDLVQAIVVHGDSHWPVVAAAATASAWLMLEAMASSPDGESLPGPMAQWLDSSFTKTVRRASSRRGERDVVAALEAVRAASLPFALRRIEGAAALAVAPIPYADFPPQVRRLQVSGLDLPRHAGHWHSGEPVDGAFPAGPLVRVDGSLSTGKAAAAAAHGLGLWLLGQDSAGRAAWRGSLGFTLSSFEQSAVQEAFAELPDELMPQVIVRDAGLTEVDPGTVTCIVEP